MLVRSNAIHVPSQTHVVLPVEVTGSATPVKSSSASSASPRRTLSRTWESEDKTLENVGKWWRIFGEKRGNHDFYSVWMFPKCFVISNRIKNQHRESTKQQCGNNKKRVANDIKRPCKHVATVTPPATNHEAKLATRPLYAAPALEVEVVTLCSSRSSSSVIVKRSQGPPGKNGHVRPSSRLQTAPGLNCRVSFTGLILVYLYEGKSAREPFWIFWCDWVPVQGSAPRL